MSILAFLNNEPGLHVFSLNFYNFSINFLVKKKRPRFDFDIRHFHSDAFLISEFWFLSVVVIRAKINELTTTTYEESFLIDTDNNFIMRQYLSAIRFPSCVMYGEEK